MIRYRRISKVLAVENCLSNHSEEQAAAIKYSEEGI